MVYLYDIGFYYACLHKHKYRLVPMLLDWLSTGNVHQNFPKAWLQENTDLLVLIRQFLSISAFPNILSEFHKAKHDKWHCVIPNKCDTIFYINLYWKFLWFIYVFVLNSLPWSKYCILYFMIVLARGTQRSSNLTV